VRAGRGSARQRELRRQQPTLATASDSGAAASATDADATSAADAADADADAGSGSGSDSGSGSGAGAGADASSTSGAAAALAPRCGAVAALVLARLVRGTAWAERWGRLRSGAIISLVLAAPAAGDDARSTRGAREARRFGGGLHIRCR
jgi:hypothetical protein